MGLGLIGVGSLLILVIIIVPIILLTSHSGSNANQSYTNSTQNTSNHALDILNERYARGEITDEEYKNKKEAILRK